MKEPKAKACGIRLPQDEIDERIEFVMELEAQALLPGQIKKAFRAKYGDTPHQTIADYVSRARARVQESYVEKRDELAKRAISRYEAIIRDPTSDTNARIRAQERIDKIWGVEAPTKSEHAGPDGGPIQIEQLISASELTHEDITRVLEEFKRSNDTQPS